MPSLRTKAEPPRGIVRGPGRGEADAPVWHRRYEPPEALRAHVEHLWAVGWHVPDGERFEASTLPHPSAHWTLEAGRSELSGVQRGRFVRQLVGAGRVVAVKFRPAGLCAFTEMPMHRLTDRTVPAQELLGAGAARLARGLDALEVEAAAARLAALLEGLPRREDAAAQTARALVARVAADPELTRVEALAREAGMGVLALQRLFRAKVGASPKWVLQRYRLHEALERLARGARAGRKGPRLAELAAELGFADQAHLTRAFKQLVGVAPAAYLEQLRVTGPSPSGRGKG